MNTANLVNVDHLFEDWFLDYASYVILDRAIPNIEDGLKPVQRRLLYALFELDDGRFNKAANVIGHTMRYHPHGDAAIGEALVKIAQREILMDIQGNWGNIATGDRAAAARYIETRLSAFAKSVVFHAPIEKWQDSYDGRNKEPIFLPVCFPLLLVHGTEGIAVGLSTKILPHNFCEIAEAAIAYLQGKPFALYPDFQTGGLIDISDYQDGRSGSKLLMRASIEERDDKTLAITSLPFGVTTTNLIESILSASDKGKIKIRKIEDNTAEKIEILVRLSPGIETDKAIKALYAFTDCEQTISPLACVIKDQKPIFCSISDILSYNVDRTMAHLKTDLEHQRDKLINQLHFLSLEKLFIEEKIYRKLEQAASYEQMLDIIEKGLKKFSGSFLKTLTNDDLEKLTEIKIKRISKYDQDLAEEQMAKLKKQLARIEEHLAHLRSYTINYFKSLIKDYGKNFKRKTQIVAFNKTNAASAALSNQKLYWDKKDGFVGTSLKDLESFATCSSFDIILAIEKSGQAGIYKVEEKVFVGKNLAHLSLLGPKDDIYIGIIAQGKANDEIWMKHCLFKAIKGRKVGLLESAKGSKAKIIHVIVSSTPLTSRVNIISSGKKNLQVSFADLPPVDRKSAYRLVGYGMIEGVEDQAEGGQDQNKLKPHDIWFDPKTNQLSLQKHAFKVGSLSTKDSVLALSQDGSWFLEKVQTSFPLSKKAVWLTPVSDRVFDLICIISDAKTGMSTILRTQCTLHQGQLKGVSELNLKKTESISLVAVCDKKRGDDRLPVGERQKLTDWPALLDILG